MSKDTAIILFGEQQVRRAWHQDTWWYSVIDVCAVLTKSRDPGAYWRKLKQRLLAEGSQSVTNCHGLKLEASDGKKYTVDCANAEGILRIIQSIPSPRAEPFKRWLAQVGQERIKEIEDPELAQHRMKQLYQQKGYPEDWIDKRVRGIAIRQDLTEEWRQRGLTNKKDYGILTAEISKATFGMTPADYKKFKHLPEKGSVNLRDHMTDLELIFTMLGEKVTTEISKVEQPVGMLDNKRVAGRGGKVAGNARIDTEKEMGKKVCREENFLMLGELKDDGS